MDNQQQQFTVPAAAVNPIVTEQRNRALDESAQWQALALQFKAERDQLTTEIEKLRADATADQP